MIYSEALTLTNNIEHFIIDTFTRLGSDGIERPVEQPDQVYIMHLKFNSIANIDKDRGRRHLRFVIQTAIHTFSIVSHWRRHYDIAIIGARAFLPSSQLGMIVDYTLSTFPRALKNALESYGDEMWAFRERTDGLPTARAVNRYQGETRGYGLRWSIIIQFFLTDAHHLGSNIYPSLFFLHRTPSVGRILKTSCLR